MPAAAAMSRQSSAGSLASARAVGEKMVYTPQMIINGTERIVGVDAAGLAALLKAADAGADDDENRQQTTHSRHIRSSRRCGPWRRA